MKSMRVTTRCFLGSRRLGDPRGGFQPWARWLWCPRDRMGQRVALHTAAGLFLLQPPPCSQGLLTECGAWEGKNLPSIHVRVISSSTALGKGTCETAFTSHWKKGKTAKILSVLSQEEMLKSWKSVCLEKGTNTTKLRSGQLKYFDFDPLYFLLCVCVCEDFVTQYFFN